MGLVAQGDGWKIAEQDIAEDAAIQTSRHREHEQANDAEALSSRE